MLGQFIKAYQISGYAYDADVHCVSCTQKTHGKQYLHCDSNGISLSAIDREGNFVHPIFATEEFDYEIACGECFEPIEVVVLHNLNSDTDEENPSD